MLGRFLTRKEQIVLYGVAAVLIVGAVVSYLHNRSAAVEPRSVAKARPAPVVPNTRPSLFTEPPAPAGQPKPVQPLPEPAREQSRTNERALIGVSVAGAVKNPGVYQFPADSRVQDAIARAGGALPDADVRDLNLAATLINGTTLVVPMGQKAAVEGRTMVMRGGQSAAAVNLPQYTLSGGYQGQGAVGVVRTSPWSQPIPANPIAAPGGGATLTTSGGLIDLNRASARELESLPGIGPVLAQSIIKYREQTPFQSLDDVNNVPGIGAGKIEGIRPFATVQPLASGSADR